MTYNELETLVSNHYSSGEWDEILDLITRENVALAVRCTGKPYTPPTFQPINRLDQLLQDYKDLRTAVEAAPSATFILGNYFMPENVLLADLGKEYRSALETVEQTFSQVTWGDPAAAAIVAVTDDFDRINLLQNPQPADEC